MRNRWILVFVLVSAIVAGALSCALLLRKYQIDGGYIDLGYGFTYGSGYTEYSYSEKLAKREPAEIQKDLKGIFDELVEGSEADLFVLKSSDDPCLLAELIFCRKIPSEKVKPFIEAALAFKQATQAREMSLKNNLISLGSLLVSFAGLIIAGLSFANRKKSL
jgi:hypothetical protein